jgi:DNA-directed RNA polymerase subunit RPC12/RpoP
MTPYVAPQQQAPAPSKAQSAAQNMPCPECGGNNYTSPSQTVALRCYDCGYPISQSGSRYGALTGAKVEGAAKGAIGNTTGGFNPMPDGYNSQGQKI